MSYKGQVKLAHAKAAIKLLQWRTAADHRGRPIVALASADGKRHIADVRKTGVCDDTWFWTARSQRVPFRIIATGFASDEATACLMATMSILNQVAHV